MANNRFSSSDAQIKKGILETCVLFMISEKPTYGYDVMKTIKQYFPEVNESTIYAILRRLYTDNCADITLSNDSGGPQRKYYHITDKGILSLENNVVSWKRINDVLTQMGLHEYKQKNLLDRRCDFAKL
ncbi:MAG: PadR family transcriptional regulator [Defluviitaleaceae bacterium]|nr:PadR family transcriptional regulator [Defluviitaleaceae bacterium]